MMLEALKVDIAAWKATRRRLVTFCIEWAKAAGLLIAVSFLFEWKFRYVVNGL